MKVTRGAPRAGADAVPGLLLALPRPHRPRRRHDRAARLQEAELVPRRPPAPDADRLLLRRDHERLRRHVRLLGPGAARRTAGRSRPTSARCSTASTRPPRTCRRTSAPSSTRASPRRRRRSTTDEPAPSTDSHAAPDAARPRAAGEGRPRRGRRLPARARRRLRARPRPVLPLVPPRLPVLGRHRRRLPRPRDAQPPHGRPLGPRAAPLPRGGGPHAAGDGAPRSSRSSSAPPRSTPGRSPRSWPPTRCCRRRPPT